MLCFVLNNRPNNARLHATLFACDIQGLHRAVIQSGPCSQFSHELLSVISISAAKKGSELVTSPDRVTPVSLCATLVPLEATWNIMKMLFLPGWGRPRFPILFIPRHHVPASAPANVSLSLSPSLPLPLSPYLPLSTTNLVYSTQCFNLRRNSYKVI